jgi:hypothetical protein
MIPLYLDPGSGSILLQLLIAGLAGLAIAVGAQWSKIKRLFNKKKAQKDEAEAEDDEEQ